MKKRKASLDPLALDMAVFWGNHFNCQTKLVFTPSGNQIYLSRKSPSGFFCPLCRHAGKGDLETIFLMSFPLKSSRYTVWCNTCSTATHIEGKLVYPRYKALLEASGINEDPPEIVLEDRELRGEEENPSEGQDKENP